VTLIGCRVAAIVANSRRRIDTARTGGLVWFLARMNIFRIYCNLFSANGITYKVTLDAFLGKLQPFRTAVAHFASAFLQGGSL